MNRREEVVGIIKQLGKIMTFEQIAVSLGVSFSTVYAWSRGARKPSNLARKALQSLLKKDLQSGSQAI